MNLEYIDRCYSHVSVFCLQIVLNVYRESCQHDQINASFLLSEFKEISLHTPLHASTHTHTQFLVITSLPVITEKAELVAAT